MTSSQVPTQPQRTNDTPTIRVQPLAAAPEPVWPTSEPMTATNLTPITTSPAAAATTKFEPVTGSPNGRANGAFNGRLTGSANGTPAPTSAPAAPATNGSVFAPAPAAPATHGSAFPPAPAAAPEAAVPAFAPGAPAPAADAPPATEPAPATAAQPAAPAAKPTPPPAPRSRLRRIARRIVGPTLLTKRG